MSNGCNKWIALQPGPLSGPLLSFAPTLSPYKATIIAEVRRPLLGTTKPSRIPTNQANTAVYLLTGPLLGPLSGPLCQVWD